MRSLNSLRNFLLDMVKEVKSGSVDVAQAESIIKTTNTIISITRLEVDVTGKSDFIIDSVKESLLEIEEREKKPYEFGGTTLL